MPYVITGWLRATSLRIIVKENGTEVSSTTFQFMEAFNYNGVAYSQINTDTVQTMPLADYIARVEAYAAYIQENNQTQFPGLIVSSAGARIESNQ